MEAYLQGNFTDAVDVDAAEVVEESPEQRNAAKGLPKRKAPGRQKISEDQRRSEGHYFSKPLRLQPKPGTQAASESFAPSSPMPGTVLEPNVCRPSVRCWSE